jgi:hypothetical protein
VGRGDRGGTGDRPVTPGVAVEPDATGEWDPVRDSWVGEEPIPHGQPVSSIPPPLPPSHVIDLMLARLAASDYDGTLIAAMSVLRRHPMHRDALQCRAMAERALRKVYEARLGMDRGGGRVPQRVSETAPGAMRSRLVFRLVDGEASIDDVVEASHLEPLETLRILSELLLSDAITIDE